LALESEPIVIGEVAPRFERLKPPLLDVHVTR
jgi:hypothetical protein